MANPNIENGFFKMSTELYRALSRTRISGEARQLLDAIICMTYGFHRKEVDLSTNYLSKITGLNKQSLYKARRKLKDRHIIRVSQKGDSLCLTYSFQKNYTLWIETPKKETVSQKDYEGSPKKTTKGLLKSTRQYKKDNLKITNKDNGTTHGISFKKPSLEQVLSILPKYEAEKFIDFYESKGWFVGKSKMKDWKAAARNWKRRNEGAVNNPVSHKRSTYIAPTEEELKYDPELAKKMREDVKRIKGDL